MTREQIIYTYMMNEKHVIAEMLHDTIESYESRICENCSKGTHVQTLGIGIKRYKCSDNVSEFGNQSLPSNNNSDFGCTKWVEK